MPGWFTALPGHVLDWLDAFGHKLITDPWLSLVVSVLLTVIPVVALYYSNRNPAKDHMCPCGARARMQQDEGEWVCMDHAWVGGWIYDPIENKTIPRNGKL